ncbi:MAG TPA: MgtC/SapB family protein [Thermoanaerobaculia bacterium]|nr:MgtC/SapB family protein [Thermoanaerobaculia bacterium]
MADPQIVVLRVALAFVFGAVAGIEREWRHKVAGIKTNALVAIGAAAFALMSDTFGPGNHNPAQLAAAVVTGIGFIGAGVIIHRGATVQGVTTAATLWANASMGVAFGLGYFVAGGTIFLGIVIVQFGLPRIVEVVAARGPRLREIELRIECDEASLEAVNRAWRDFVASRRIFVSRHSTTRSEGLVLWRAVFIAIGARGVDVTTIEESLVGIQGISSIDARQTTPADDIP